MVSQQAQVLSPMQKRVQELQEQLAAARQYGAYLEETLQAAGVEYHPKDAFLALALSRPDVSQGNVTAPSSSTSRDTSDEAGDGTRI